MLVAVGPIGVLPRADGVHAEPVDDRAARVRVLLRVLRLRAAVPGSLPRPAAGGRLRARAGRPASLPRASRSVAGSSSAACSSTSGSRRRSCSLPGSSRPPASCPVLFLREDGGHGRVFEGVRVYVRHSWRVLRRNPDVGRFLLANAAWEGTFAGARTFVVLYITVGLDESLGDVHARARRRRRRVRRRGARLRLGRRPLRPRPGDHVVLGRLRARAARRRASRRSGTRGTWR